jgi:hypothetical protein
MMNRQIKLLMAIAVLAVMTIPIAAMASAGFDDVADDNIFTADIQWLADAGVTKGCNPPANTKYCPEANVTRQQIAAFMHRLGTNQVVDAGALQGHTAAQLAPRAVSNHESNKGVQVALGTVVQTTITAPAPGMLIAHGNVALANTHEYDRGACWLEADNHGIDLGSSAYTMNPPAHDLEDCAVSGAAIVPAGTHEVSLWLDCIESCTTTAWGGDIWVMWVPFDGQGETPESS